MTTIATTSGLRRAARIVLGLILLGIGVSLIAIGVGFLAGSGCS